MASPQVSKEALRAIAILSRLPLSQERLDALLPQVQRAAEATSALDELALDDVEPAVAFRPVKE